MELKSKITLTSLCLSVSFFSLQSCDADKKSSEQSPENPQKESVEINEIKDKLLASAMLATPTETLPYGIKNVIATGPGCKSESIAVSLSNENRTLSILFDNFDVEADGENTEVTAENHCEIEIEIVPPKNHAVGIFNQLLLGYGYLEEKGHANFVSQFNFKGHPKSVNLHHEFIMHGPYDNNFEFLNKTPLLWAPCSAQSGAQENITLLAKTKMIARAEKGSYSFMALDAHETELGITLDMDFVPCEDIQDPTPTDPTPPNPPTINPDELLCESRGYAYNSCRVSGIIQSIYFLQQYSDAPCTLGETFGFHTDRIWVDRGCSALFRYTLKAIAPPSPPVINELRCESHGYKYNFCSFAKITSAELITQHSTKVCRKDKNWGVIAGKGLWVDHGCRATFFVKVSEQEEPLVGFYKDIVCESHSKSLNSCPVTSLTARNIEILDQFSNSACVKNQNFGVLNTGAIWVNHGCRGLFRVYDF